MSSFNIQSIVDIFAKPESVDKVRAILLSLIEYSRNEDGCLHYKIFENINDESQFTIVGIWKNDEALENHLLSDHIQKASFDINQDVTKAPDVKRYRSLEPDSKQMKSSKTTSQFCLLI